MEQAIGVRRSPFDEGEAKKTMEGRGKPDVIVRSPFTYTGMPEREQESGSCEMTAPASASTDTIYTTYLLSQPKNWHMCRS